MTDEQAYNTIFQNNPALLKEPEVNMLIKYCDSLEERLLENTRTELVRYVTVDDPTNKTKGEKALPADEYPHIEDFKGVCSQSAFEKAAEVWKEHWTMMIEEVSGTRLKFGVLYTGLSLEVSEVADDHFKLEILKVDEELWDFTEKTAIRNPDNPFVISYLPKTIIRNGGIAKQHLLNCLVAFMYAERYFLELKQEKQK